MLNDKSSTSAPKEHLGQMMCLFCGWVYDPEVGAPDDGVPAGTPWEDIPMNWVCPDCGARKEEFDEMVF